MSYLNNFGSVFRSAGKALAFPALMQGMLMGVLLSANLIQAQTVSLSGTITASDNSPLEGLTIQIQGDGGSTTINSNPTDSLGNYSLSLSAGNYDILEVRTIGSNNSLVPDDVNVTIETPFIINTNRIVDFQLPEYPRIFGIVKDDLGNPIENVTVGFEPIFNPNYFDTAITNALGEYELRGSPGPNTIIITPDGGSAFLPTTFEISNLTGDLNQDLVITDGFNLSGVIESSDGIPLEGLFLQVNKNGNTQTSDPSNAFGEYSFKLAPDTYDLLEVRTIGSNNPFVPDDTNISIESPFTISENTTRTLTLPAFPRIYGTVEDDMGNPIPNVTFSFDVMNPPFVFNLDVSNASGEWELRGKLGDNTFTYQPSATFANGMETVTNVTTDTLVNIVLTAPVTLSGTILTSDGQPAEGTFVQITEGGNTVVSSPADVNGDYSIELAPEVYDLIEVRTQSSNNPLVPDDINITVATDYDVASSPTLDVMLPVFPRIFGVLRDSDGNPLENATASTEPGTAQQFDMDTSAVDGSFELRVLSGFNAVKFEGPSGQMLTPVVIPFSVEEEDIEFNYQFNDDLLQITRVQPSVITAGESGSIILTSVGTNFEQGMTGVDFGSDITVNTTEVISPITVRVDVKVNTSPTLGYRDVYTTTGLDQANGFAALAIIDEVNGPFETNPSDELTSGDLVLGDITGTFLKVNEGTIITLPNGVIAKKLNFLAPFTNDLISGVLSNETLVVQRLFGPPGTTFNPPAELTLSYRDEDIIGVEESNLTVGVYENGPNSIVEELTIINHDLEANRIKVEVPHFSILRLAVEGTSDISDWLEYRN